MRGPSIFVISSQPGFGPTCVSMPYCYHQYTYTNQQLPFLATLDLPDLLRLTNDPIQHGSFWPTIPAKLSSDIPKFDEKPREDPNNHVITFHLWCSSNSLMDDAIRQRLFQRTLIGVAVKWYIELLRNSFIDFNSLAMDFLTHFFGFLYGMRPVHRFLPHSGNPLPPTYMIIFMREDDGDS
jgi:hypothetical protein